MIGVLLKEKDGGEVVLALCAPGFPAEESRTEGGDIIVAVDEVWVEELMEEDYGLAEVRHRLLGKAGSKLKLTIDRNREVFDVGDCQGCQLRRGQCYAGSIHHHKDIVPGPAALEVRTLANITS